VEAEAEEGMVEEEEDKDPLALCTPRMEERSTMVDITDLTRNFHTIEWRRSSWIR
jgi:hypothetical protein